MDAVTAVILGIIQGLTEFLPVSSSGHLVLAQHCLGLKTPELFFDVSLHMGTLLATVLIFWRDLWNMARALVRTAYALLAQRLTWATALEDRDLRIALMIIAGTLPTGVIGLYLHHHHVEQLFSSIRLVSGMLVLNGLILWSTRWIAKKDFALKRLTIGRALIVGVVQGVSVVPGISRSGSTITAALGLGIERESAARFSFLLSLPAIMGAELLAALNALKTGPVAGQPGALITLLGAGVAALTGYFALILLLKVVKAGRFHIFAPYCWAVAALALWLS